jgi:8-oxo-dGTP pyrophosphatase MutT (NUDIX family)
MKRKEMVVFLRQGNQVLLGLKTKKLGDGKRNGYGGGIKKKESIRDASVRELEKELGIIVNSEDLQEQGFLDIEIRTGIWQSDRHYLHIFTLEKWQGEFKAGNGELVDPQWFNIDELPANMIDSDKAWLSYVLKGNQVQGEIIVRLVGSRVTSFNFNVIY